MLLLHSIAKKAWYFSDKPWKTYPFLNEYGTRASVPVAKVGVNQCALHEDGYKGLKPEQRYNVFLRRFKNYFKPGGKQFYMQNPDLLFRRTIRLKDAFM